MKFNFLFFTILIGTITNISLVHAGLGLSPGKINFDVQGNDEQCKEVTVVSDDYAGELRLRDVWSNSKEESNINNFDMEANDFGFDISYPETINIEDKETIEICLSGGDLREARGALIFTPDSDTNIVVEVGAWIFVKELEVGDESIGGSPSITGNVIGGGSGMNKSLIAVVLIAIIAGVFALRMRRKTKNEM